MTEQFTAEFIASEKRQLVQVKADTTSTIVENVIATHYMDALDEIERQTQRIAELEQERAGILVTLDEVVKEAYLQKPFSDDAGMNLLHGASLLLKKMLPQPPQEGE